MSKQNTEACEFVRSTRLEERLRVVPVDGRSGEELLELLNAGQVQIVGDSLLLSLEEGSCCEGQVVLGKILVNERPEHPKPWRQLGPTKTKARGKGKVTRLPVKIQPPVTTLPLRIPAPPAPTQEPAVTTLPARVPCTPVHTEERPVTTLPLRIPAPDAQAPEEHPASAWTARVESVRPPADQPAHADCHNSAHMIAQAGKLRLSAEQLLQDSPPDTGGAEAALKAARALLEAADGLYSAEAHWLTNAEALLADKRGDTGEALSLLRTAALTAAIDLGVGDPDAIVLSGNCAQYEVQHGDAGGKADLENVIRRLERTQPYAHFTQEWLDAAKLEFRTTLAQADQLIADFNRRQEEYRPPVAEAVCDVETEFGTDCCNVEPAAAAPAKPPGPALVRRRVEPVKGWQRPAGSLWLDKNRLLLPAKQWSACTGNGVVAHDPDYDGLIRKLNAIGVALGDVTLAFNETDAI